MKVLNKRKLLIAGVIFSCLLLVAWAISSAGLIIQRIAEVRQELLARHSELMRIYGELVK